MKFAEKLKAARERAGLSQIELATLAGVDRKQICYYEHGKKASSEGLQRLAKALQCDEEALYDDPEALTVEVKKTAILSICRFREKGGTVCGLSYRDYQECTCSREFADKREVTPNPAMECRVETCPFVIG